MDVAAFRRDLLDWYRVHARDLPWRHQDAYAVAVSEFMLQQTRVGTVLGRYAAWMRRFPDWQALAAASEEDVLAAWSGLGYYRRARMLHALARRVADAGMPQDASDLVRLPGVGPYTASAIASIAYARPVAAVDGNVRRVAARVAGIDGALGEPALERSVQTWADEVLAAEAPGDWNQAMMELGATVCTPRPACDRCPVRRHCRSSDGSHTARPAPRRRRAPRVEHHHYAVVQHAGETLLVREPGTGLLGGLWRLPGGAAARPLEDLVASQTGLRVHVRSPSCGVSVEHRFTHRTWYMTVHRAELRSPGSPPARPPGATETMASAWIGDLDQVGLSTAMRKAIAAATAESATAPGSATRGAGAGEADA